WNFLSEILEQLPSGYRPVLVEVCFSLEALQQEMSEYPASPPFVLVGEFAHITGRDNRIVSLSGIVLHVLIKQIVLSTRAEALATNAVAMAAVAEADYAFRFDDPGEDVLQLLHWECSTSHVIG